jgi:hypothetical protein
MEGPDGVLSAPCYVVQTFTDLNGQLVPDMPLDASNASEAADFALAFRSCKAGVIAFEWSGEMHSGRYDPPYVLARFGRIPNECRAWMLGGSIKRKRPSWKRHSLKPAVPGYRRRTEPRQGS